jgi:hypothetical protein
LKCIFIREIQALKDFSPHHKAVIFDDINALSFGREELINLTDVENDSEIRILYKSIKIPAGTVKIITTNAPETFTKHGTVVERRLSQVLIQRLLTTGKKEDE